MARVKKTVYFWKCERCGYEWLSRTEGAEPSGCPNCKSPYWNKPRIRNLKKKASKSKV